MSKDESNVPYLMRSYTPVKTDSSFLVSSSPYLNDYRIREWVVSQSLRRNGKDNPQTFGIPMLIDAMRDVQPHARIEELFNKARKDWPELDRWLDDRWLSTLRRDDMASCPEGSLGGIWYKQLKSANMEVDIIPAIEPRSSFEYFFMRGVQIHDFMHILAGGGFDYIGEIIPAYLKYGNLFQHLDAELAGLLNVQNTLLTVPMFIRGPLHYPQLFTRMWDLANYAMEVGRNSDALFLPRYEDYLDLPLEEARRKFGVRGARTIDTTKESEFWDEHISEWKPEQDAEPIAAE
ncbi:hypothetical protein MB02_07405 [Croceicoccus estronivorus]|uniref:Coq4 family protein n=1 Tax=Croceicoccus estronivorus TaxID=1172626 RepID=UPI00082F86ED|nr:Coq4 family protein [Croceicoccus estronivorus]OCC24399.1 hypothetical protein MB02_07405 [Croceicoccus estronivorus]